jgi:hypothetical protein
LSVAINPNIRRCEKFAVFPPEFPWIAEDIKTKKLLIGLKGSGL